VLTEGGVVPNVPTVAAATAKTFVIGVIIVTVSLLLLSLLIPSRTLCIVWCVYPFCPDVLRNASKVRQRMYAAWMNVFRAGYVFVAIASQVLKSFIERRLDPTRIQTAFRMICSVVNGTCPMIWIS
jgi:hypothetical protein